MAEPQRDRGVPTHLERNPQRGVDGEVEGGLEAAARPLSGSTLGRQVSERVTGQPGAVPEPQRHGREQQA